MNNDTGSVASGSISACITRCVIISAALNFVIFYVAQLLHHITKHLKSFNSAWRASTELTLSSAENSKSGGVAFLSVYAGVLIIGPGAGFLILVADIIGVTFGDVFLCLCLDSFSERSTACWSSSTRARSFLKSVCQLNKIFTLN